MSLLSGAVLRKAIAGVLNARELSCAVAFWGRGAQALIGSPQNRNIRLICNLKMGGTNPDVIEYFMDRNIAVQQNDRLHAKIYIGDTMAVMTSANASINGLGVEGEELAGWIETGMELSREEALLWFEGMWKQSSPISKNDIEQARRLFRERAILKPTRGSFAAFHPTEDDFPLVDWVGSSDYDYNDKEIKRNLGYVDETVHDQIDEGLDVEAPGDLALFRRGLWVLRWQITRDGMPDQRSGLWWTRSSGIYVPKAFTYKGGKPQGIILALRPKSPVPFDTSEQRFVRAFHEVIRQDKFKKLRDQEYEGSFHAERWGLERQFWGDLKRYYTNGP